MAGRRLDVRAIILAAGRGSRLNPYTADHPKCLTELGGETLIGRQLRTLRALGVDDIVIATGYRREMLQIPGTREAHNPGWERTNMVETLFCAEAEFGRDLIVAYGDIVYEPRVLAALLDCPRDTAVVVDRNWRAYWEMRFSDPLSDAESLRLEPGGRIADIGRPVSDIAEVEAQYMGLMRFRGAGVAALSAARRNFREVRRPWMKKRTPANAYMTDLLMEMILMGYAVHAVPVSGGWLEIDTVEDYEKSAAMFADGSISRFFDAASGTWE